MLKVGDIYESGGAKVTVKLVTGKDVCFEYWFDKSLGVLSIAQFLESYSPYVNETRRIEGLEGYVSLEALQSMFLPSDFSVDLIMLSDGRCNLAYYLYLDLSTTEPEKITEITYPSLEVALEMLNLYKSDIVGVNLDNEED